MQSSFWKALTNTINFFFQKVASKWTFILLWEEQPTRGTECQSHEDAQEDDASSLEYSCWASLFQVSSSCDLHSLLLVGSDRVTWYGRTHPHTDTNEDASSSQANFSFSLCYNSQILTVIANIESVDNSQGRVVAKGTTLMYEQIGLNIAKWKIYPTIFAKRNPLSQTGSMTKPLHLFFDDCH